MSIEILTGVPGAGKTYFAVHAIHALTKSDQKFLVLHNIEGLQCQDFRIISVDWKTEDFNAQAMADRLRQLRTEYSLDPSDIIHIYIDEAQRFFPPELKDQQVLYFFDYHRHFGVNVTLITQHEKKLTYKITTLAESEIRAVSQKINPFGSFVYKLSAGGEQYSTTRLSKDKHIFALYKSFQAGTGKARKSRFRYLAAALVVGGVVAWFLFFKVFAHSFGLDKQKADSAPVATVSTNIASTLSRPVSAPPQPLQPAKPEEQPEPEYLAPPILDYDQTKDRLKITLPKMQFEGWVTVAQYVHDYPPQLYGYGYFHAPNRKFVLTSSQTKNVIFPVRNALASVQYLNQPKAEQKVPEYDPYPDYAYALPARSSEYSSEDQKAVFRWRRMINAYQAWTDGSRYSPPPVPSTMPKPEQPATQPAAAPPASGDPRQPGAPAGAAPPLTPMSNRG